MEQEMERDGWNGNKGEIRERERETKNEKRKMKRKTKKSWTRQEGEIKRGNK